jgi:hypothetical protein
MQAIRKRQSIKLMLANMFLVVLGYFIGWFCYSDLRDEINRLHVQIFDAQASLEMLKENVPIQNADVVAEEMDA